MQLSTTSPRAPLVAPATWADVEPALRARAFERSLRTALPRQVHEQRERALREQLARARAVVPPRGHQDAYECSSGAVASSAARPAGGPAPIAPETVTGMVFALQSDNYVQGNLWTDRVASAAFSSTGASPLVGDTTTLPGHTLCGSTTGTTRWARRTTAGYATPFNTEVYSFGAFVMWPGGTAGSTIINLRNATTTADGLMRVTPTASAFVLQTDGTSGTQTGPTINWTNPQPAYAHLSFSRDSGGNVSAYVNGILQGTGTVAAKTPVFTDVYLPASTGTTVNALYGGFWGASASLAQATHEGIAEWYFQSFGM